MNEFMVMMYNRAVKPEDRVYMLGDVAFNKRDLVILNRMNGRKVLIKGNHDNLDLKDYLPYFDDIRAVHTISGLILTIFLFTQKALVDGLITSMGTPMQM